MGTPTPLLLTLHHLPTAFIPLIRDKQRQHSITRRPHYRGKTTMPDPSLKCHTKRLLWRSIGIHNISMPNLAGLPLHRFPVHRNSRHLRTRCGPLGTSNTRDTRSMQSLRLCLWADSRLSSNSIQDPGLSSLTIFLRHLSTSRSRPLQYPWPLSIHLSPSPARIPERMFPPCPHPTRIIHQPRPLGQQWRRV